MSFVFTRPVRKDEPPPFDYRTVRDFPGDDWWRALQRIADSRDPELRRLFLAAVADVVSATRLAQIREALESGDPAGAVEAVPWDRLASNLARMRAVLAEIHRAAGRQAASTLLETAGFALDFALVEPRAVAWAEAHAAVRITQGVVEESRRAIQRVVLRGARGELAIREQARLIYDVVGLTERQAAAVQNFLLAQLADGTAADVAGRKAAEYADRLRRHRALNIARTETLDAANAGQRALWEAASQESLLDATTWEREWVAVVPSDGRTCALCIGMDGRRAPIGGTYPGGVVGPTLHTACRCAERLVERAVT